MKYKLYKNNDSSLSTLEKIFVNRGIPKEKVADYLNTTDSNISSYLLLGENNLKKGAMLIAKAASTGKKALVVWDCDADGMTSSSILLNYLYDLFPAWVETKVEYFLHEGKVHGLADCMDIATQYDLVILPDASSNEPELHKTLLDAGIDVLVLDHHSSDSVQDSRAVIINNQLCDYPNKSLSGAGVVWQFCRYMDSLLGKNYANNYIDLVAVGLVSDMMSLRDLETRHIVTVGTAKSAIKSPLIQKLSSKNEFLMNKRSSALVENRITPMGVAFGISPFLNAMVRSGTMQEKQLIARALLKFRAYDKIPSTKKGHKMGEVETVVDQAVRVMGTVKNRQTKAEESAITIIHHKIAKEGLEEDKVIVILLEPGIVAPSILGLAANKVRPIYKRPVLMLTRKFDEKQGEFYYRGSARGFSEGGIENFRKLCKDSGYVEWARGHEEAFGISIKESDIERFKKEMNENLLEDFTPEDVYNIDCIYQGDQINVEDIGTIAGLVNYWGQEVPEPYLAVEKLKITSDMVNIYRKTTNTMKITVGQVSLIKFKVTGEEIDLFKDNNEGYVEVNIVGRASVNEYNGSYYPQIQIEDYEVTHVSEYFF